MHSSQPREPIAAPGSARTATHLQSPPTPLTSCSSRIRAFSSDAGGGEADSGALQWHDSEEVAEKLFEAEPKLNPLNLRFTQLAEKVMALESFSGTQKECNEKKLEAIQMAWYELYKEENE
ncbi:unnamed protein product [Vitrella brassicaformis CCMP3155]|uniref:Uncharacterized protein n=1 Tax=Vitrella brassicaformis (strain CCMP3155) TaxID=1169540 RepID=A0A0G4GW93_VITBC|nr:unnamed protein product [Vitrella brassicaformis CCMP3155]|eukprot:CEM35277.1 unnamed protein product [Vitrella brassicaformis CCMP3155]